jgi:hypothetical protein
VELDGQKLTNIPYPDQSGSLWLERTEEGWHCIGKPPLTNKGPHRYGSITEELQHRFLLVYGTKGTPEENAWAFGKARYDAETFLYRGNASMEVLADTAFAPARDRDRTVVLYGNAETNAAWPALLGKSPVQVHGGRVQLGDRRFEGENLSAIFIRPRPDSDIASVVAVSGTGPVGMRSTYSTSFFVPFVRYPDCMIARAEPEDSQGSENLAAGYFGLDWSVDQGEFVFSDR